MIENGSVTGDELWVFEYDPEAKRQSMERSSSTSPTSKRKRKNEQDEDQRHADFFLHSQGQTLKTKLPIITERFFQNFEKGLFV